MPLVVFALDNAAKSTIGLVVVFFVIFPVVVQGLIMYAIAQALAERQENLRHSRWRRR